MTPSSEGKTSKTAQKKTPMTTWWCRIICTPNGHEFFIGSMREIGHFGTFCNFNGL